MQIVAIRDMRKIMKLSIMVLLFIFCVANAQAITLNIDFGSGMTERSYMKDGDFTMSTYPADNRRTDYSFHVGFSGDVYRQGDWALLWDAKYYDLGTGTGNRNTVCSPDGCMQNSALTDWTGTMTTKQYLRGFTVGIGIEYAYKNFFMRPEFGYFYGLSQLTSVLQDHSGSLQTRIHEENEINSYYYGGKIGYRTKWADVYAGVRFFPSSGGPQMMYDDTVSYEVGLSIPIF